MMKTFIIPLLTPFLCFNFGCEQNPSSTPPINTDSIAELHSVILANQDTLRSYNTLQFHDHDSTYPCQIENPDSIVSGIMLCDYNSSVTILGRHWEIIENNIDMLHQNFSSLDGKQFLTPYFHYGGYKYSYSEFQVSYTCNEPIVDTLRTNVFETGNGIRLGMKRDQVVEIIGECYKTDTLNGNLVLKYISDDYLNSPFLRRWNYPTYYAHYEFEENQLIRFRFGFEYP